MINQKKLLLLHSSNDLYGASKIFLQIIELLKSNGHQIHVVLPSKGPLDKMISQIKGTHVSYYSLGVLRKKYLNPLGLINRLVANIKAIAFLSKYIQDHSIDLVYTNTVSYTHLRAHETLMNLVCRLLLEKTHEAADASACGLG